MRDMSLPPFISRTPSIIAKKTDVKLDFDKIINPLDHAGCKKYSNLLWVFSPPWLLTSTYSVKNHEKSRCYKGKTLPHLH